MGELEHRVILLEISVTIAKVIIGYLQYQMAQVVALIVVYFHI